jgi:EAL domain-containing protein (putative c-di-GMP-specific phosphodiesterase class I)/GGDEF domain-containing protein
VRHIAQHFPLIGALIMMAFTVQANPGSKGYAVPDADYLRVAPSEQVGLDEALASDLWQPLEEESLNFGYISDVVWLRFHVPDLPGNRALLEIRYPQLDDITFFLLENGKLTEQLVTGDRYPFNQRPVAHRNFLFPFRASPGNRYEIVLRVETQGAMQVPVRIWTPTAFFEQISITDQLHSVYYGIMLSVLFFNLFIFLALRERMYLLYVLTTAGYLLLIGTLNGTAFHRLWPGLPELQNQAMMILVPTAVIFTLLFSREFLKLRRTGPTMDLMIRFAIALNIGAFVISFVTSYSVASQLSVALAIPSCLLLTIIGPVQWARGNPQASYYTIAWGLLTLGSAVAAANKYGLLPNNFFTAYAIEIGSATEAILLTIALAARLYQEREDKVRARESEIAAMAARRHAEVRLIDQALHHPLTGLPNRTSLEMAINELINRDCRTRYSIGVIHLTNLQAITKTLGYRNTDRLIELAAKRFNATIRELPGSYALETSGTISYYVASLETDTFGFVVATDDIARSPKAMVRALEEIREPLDYLGMQLPLDPRTGTAIYPDHADDATTLIRRAYIAQGSEDARDRGLAFYQPSRDSFSADRLTLVSELRTALQNDELRLYLQPKLSLKSHSIVGLEALIRWPGRQTPVRPDEIIAIAEQTGLIKPLTRWVLENALRLRAQLHDQGFPLDVSVNISPNNLHEPDFPIFVKRLMSNYQSARGAITLEVTETSMMQDPVNSLKALNSLHSTGIPLSIDDFGSGYSSLSYIKQLPASEIKIDQSLITELLSQTDDRVIVRTTIEMCHSLGYRVVAEGVEDDDTLALLEEMGCDMIQGYVLTPPLPFDELTAWIRDFNSEDSARQIG